ncbi:hypothetical protein MPSEU_000260700 [Mayamaea pseudoterrestris]|nr:hypothetical protein MPSEU_000260700 [Mayamaea pseudoterrestris]
MPDVLLIICCVVAFVVLALAGLYLLVYYSHPDDKNDAYLPKLTVISGFMLAGITVLMFPLDVANNEGYAGCAGYDTKFCGGMNMEGMWNALFWMIPMWVFLLIPFMTFYYEADDGMIMAGTSVNPEGKKQSKLCQALCYEFFVAAIALLFFGVAYAAMAETNIPVQEYQSPSYKDLRSGLVQGYGPPVVYTISPYDTINATFSKSDLTEMGSADAHWQQPLKSTGYKMTLTVGVSTFYGGLMAWVGWFLFCLFGGIGLAALPLDLILTYQHRPKHMDAQEFAEAQQSLRVRVNELVEVGELLKIKREERAQAGLTGGPLGRFSLDGDKRKAIREDQQSVTEFKQAVYLMEEDVQDFKDATSNYDNYNPLTPYIALLLGCVSTVISFFWFLHICIYVFPTPPLRPFLNAYFKWFDSWFPLFGVLSVAVFTSYLLVAALKGCFKFGIRFMFFQIHPMKPGKTYMSSFMFNIGLLLLCALPVVQFCQQAFAGYAANSNIRQMFGTQIQNLKFFGWWWRSKVFIYLFLIFFILATMYLCCKPKDKSADARLLRDRLRERSPGGAAASGSLKAEDGELT